MVAKLSALDFKVLRLISLKHFSCGALAKELKLSRATTAKLIASLRKKGLPISTRRDAEGWFYEVQAHQDPELRGLIGAGGRGGKHYSTSIDQYLVEQMDARSKKRKAIAG